MRLALITKTSELKDLCNKLKGSEFIAVDTEFIRDRTYYARLCLVQIATGDFSVAVDCLSDGLDKTLLFEALADRKITKVFHAGRQDLEIFLNLSGKLPQPIFDTQIAAMVCGYDEQVGYDRLARGMLGVDIDKSQRFTNWAKRPLSKKQLQYALDDVIYLAQLYPRIRKEIKDSGREDWLAEETAALTEPSLYQTEPMEVWLKIKKRGNKPQQLNRLRYLACWREGEAQKLNIPRNHLIRDETLVAIAEANPKNQAGLAHIRDFSSNKTKLIPAILEALKKAEQVPKSEMPRLNSEKRKKPPQATLDLLRVLLKHCAEEAKVAPRLIANAEQLERIATGEHRLTGWRHEIFGKHAEELIKGKTALSAQGKAITIHHLKGQ